MTASGLQQQVGVFARVVDATLCAVLGGSAHLQATTDEGDNFVVTTTGEGVPLTKAGQDFLKLRVSFLCGWDGPQRYVRVDRSEIHLLPHDSTRPLLRYEFSQDAHEHRPIAHIHVHTDDDRILSVMSDAGAATRTGRKHARRARSGKAQPADLHLPLGGARFRPALEDVLHMAVEEFGIDAQPAWVENLANGRESWRRIQTRAVVRDAPETAAATLRGMGYAVTSPDDIPEDAIDRLRKF